MKKVVWKYKLEKGFHTKLKLPRGAEFLHVGAQHDGIYLWALVDPDRKPEEERHILFISTGHEMEDFPVVRHINTFLEVGGTLVFHAFEIL